MEDLRAPHQAILAGRNVTQRRTTVLEPTEHLVSQGRSVDLAGRRPRIRPDATFRVLTGNGVFLFHSGECEVLLDPLCERLLPLLDGLRTTRQIVAQLEKWHAKEEVYFTLLRLEEDGHIVSANREADAEREAFWASAGLQSGHTESSLAAAAVELQGVGAVRLDSLVAALKLAGISESSSPGLRIVWSDDYLRPELADINNAALESGIPWLLVRPNGRQLWIGPVFRPGSGACWECLASRLRSTRFLEDFVARGTSEAPPIVAPTAALPLTLAMAAQLTALEAVKYFVSARRKFAETTLTSFEVLQGKTELHRVGRRAYCRCQPSCGRSATPQPPEFVSRKKTFTCDGGHRTATPGETLAKYRHLISPITGIVDSIEQIHGISTETGSHVFHVATSGHNFAFQFKNMRAFAENMRSRSAGKGMTREQAQAGALAEAVERYSAVYAGTEPRISGSYCSLRERAIHPNECMLFSERQYGLRQRIRFVSSDYTARIPARFDETAVMDWSPVYSLTKETWCYLPTVYLYFPSQVGPTPANSSQFFYCDSNGNAAGNVLEEAVLQGFLELVERDCVALWWYNRLCRPAVDLSSFNEAAFMELVAFYNSNDRDVWVLDITNDIGIPAFAALSKLHGAVEESIIFGFGCHLEPRLGVSRALTEMNQMLALSFGLNEQRGIARGLDRDLNEWFREATLASEPYLQPSLSKVRRVAGDYPVIASEDLRIDLERCRAKIEALGMEFLVLDQTRPEAGMPAVKVIVPGMRHFWPRFAPGRLYDVPVQLGWRKQATAEADLNPRRMFF